MSNQTNKGKHNEDKRGRTYISDEAVVWVEIPVNDAHGMKISLMHGNKEGIKYHKLNPKYEMYIVTYNESIIYDFKLNE